MNDAPCRKCDRRGCGAYHDICPTYKEWAEKKAKQRLAETEERMADNIIMKHRHTAFRIWAKKSRRKADE